MGVDLVAVALVGLEWTALGWIAGATWPGIGAAWASWAVRLLVGAVLSALAALVLAFTPAGFGNPVVVLAVSAVAAVVIRAVTLHETREAGSEDDRCEKEQRITRREAIGWGVFALVLAAAAVRAIVVPEAGWDAYSHWGLKALAYAQTGRIVDTHTVHEYYPPLVPLLETSLFVQRGAANIDLGKDVWALVGSAFAICIACHLRLLLLQRWLVPFAATGVVLASTQLLEDFSTGQADLALTAFLTLATLGAVRWLRDGRRAWLGQVAIFSAAAALTKYEGLPRIAVLAIAVVVMRRKDAWTVIAAFAGGALVGQALWIAFEVTHGIAPTGEHVGGLQLSSVGATITALAEVFGGLRTGGAIVVVVLAWLVAARHTFAARTRLLALVIIGQALATLIAFLISDTAPDVEVRTAATRLVEQFMPVALVASAVWLESELIIRPWR